MVKLCGICGEEVKPHDKKVSRQVKPPETEWSRSDYMTNFYHASCWEDYEPVRRQFTEEHTNGE